MCPSLQPNRRNSRRGLQTPSGPRPRPGIPGGRGVYRVGRPQTPRPSYGQSAPATRSRVAGLTIGNTFDTAATLRFTERESRVVDGNHLAQRFEVSQEDALLSQLNPPFRAEHIGSLLRPKSLLDQRGRLAL